MHLDSPDKRPTEYGQNLKEFIKQEKLLIAVSTLQIVQEILAVPELIIISLWAVSILKESSSRQSIGVTHCYPSIIEWSRIWGGRDWWLDTNITHSYLTVSLYVSGLLSRSRNITFIHYVLPLPTLHSNILSPLQIICCGRFACKFGCVFKLNAFFILCQNGICWCCKIEINTRRNQITFIVGVYERYELCHFHYIILI